MSHYPGAYQIIEAGMCLAPRRPVRTQLAPKVRGTTRDGGFGDILANLGLAGMQASERPGGLKVVAGAAAVGLVAGAAMPIVGGVTLAATGAIAAATMAATRNDELGDLARAAGQTTVHAAEKVAAYNREHDVTGKICSAVGAAAVHAKQIDQKYQVVATLGAAATLTAAKARQADDRNLPPQRMRARTDTLTCTSTHSCTLYLPAFSTL